MSSSNFIEQQKSLYRTLKPCFCSAIQEIVYFNSDGLNHLLYNKFRPRNHSHKHYRVALIDYLTEVIAKSLKAELTSYATPPCKLWALEAVEVADSRGQKYIIKVILRRNGNGNVHFWSVMSKKVGNGDKTKKPKP